MQFWPGGLVRSVWGNTPLISDNICNYVTTVARRRRAAHCSQLVILLHRTRMIGNIALLPFPTNLLAKPPQSTDALKSFEHSFLDCGILTIVSMLECLSGRAASRWQPDLVSLVTHPSYTAWRTVGTVQSTAQQCSVDCTGAGSGDHSSSYLNQRNVINSNTIQSDPVC